MQEENIWIIKISLALFIIVFTHLFFAVCFYFARKHAKTDGRLNNIKHIVFFPLKYIITIFCIYYIFKILSIQYNLTSINGLDTIAKFILIISLALIFLFWKNMFLQKMKRETLITKITLDHSSLEFIGKLISILVVGGGGLLLMHMLGIKLEPILAFGGLGAVIFGIAARDAVANVVGGFVIHFNRPFVKDEYIRIIEKEIEGTILSIGWYYTLLKSKDNASITLPNSLISNSMTLNNTRRTHLRMEETISIKLSDFNKLPKFIESVQKYFDEEKSIDKSLNPLIYCENIREHAFVLSIGLYFFVNSEGLALQKQRVLFKIKSILEHHDMQIAHPISTVEFANKI